jgi:hypothetical protein
LPSSLSAVLAINSGRLGLTQTGKVITAYPAADTDYTRLIEALCDAWPRTNGPHPLSDLLLDPDSSISMRYGSFGSRHLLVGPAGNVDVALVTPEGTRVPDIRTVDGSQPSWAPPCPTHFQFRESHNSLPSLIKIDEHEYFPICLLQHTAKGHVALCADRSLVTHIVKTARRGVLGDLNGADAISRLMNEFQYLERVSHLGIAPLPLHIKGGPFAVAVISDVQGTPLSSVKPIDRLRLMPALATVLSQLHSEAIVHRDIKPQNVLVTGGKLNLIDFELASESRARTSIVGGTAGYFRQAELASTEESRDVYGLGMCLAQALMDYDPPLVPGGRTKVIQLLRAAGKPLGAKLVGVLTQPRRDSRPTAAKAAELLESALPLLVGEAENKYSPNGRGPSKKWIKKASLSAGKATRGFQVKTPEGHYWRNAHLHADMECEALNIGAAGIILGLMTLETAFGTDEFTEDITNGVNHLAGKPATGQAVGLLTGHAGVGLALAIAGLRYGRDDLIDKGKRRILSAAPDSPELDFFTGLAGVAWTACVVGDLLGDASLIELADTCVARLCESAINSDGLVCWDASETMRDGSTMPFLGAAHGATGIAMALAHVGRHLANEKAKRMGIDSLKRIWIRYHPSGPMPARVDESPSKERLGHWCHGTAGFVWAILQVFGNSPELAEALQWGIDTLDSSTWLGNPTYCHGVSGHLEMWRMATSIEQYRSIASRRCKMALMAIKLQQHSIAAHDVWSSEEPDVVTPDLWIGFLSPATALALWYTEAPGALLSLEWLKRCADTGPSSGTVTASNDHLPSDRRVSPDPGR